MRKLWGQRGFTAIEMLAGLAIGGLLIAGAVMAIFQLDTVSRQGSDELEAWHDIRVAGQWMGREILMAETITLVDGAAPVSSMSLTWKEYTGLDDGQDYIPHTISYSLVGTELRRTYDGSEMTMARNVVSLELSRAGRVITITLRSSPGGVTEEVTFISFARPDLI